MGRKSIGANVEQRYFTSMSSRESFCSPLLSSAGGVLGVSHDSGTCQTIEGLVVITKPKQKFDLERVVKCISCKDRFDLSWDVLVLATGSKTNTFGTRSDGK